MNKISSLLISLLLLCIAQVSSQEYLLYNLNGTTETDGLSFVLGTEFMYDGPASEITVIAIGIYAGTGTGSAAIYRVADQSLRGSVSDVDLTGPSEGGFVYTDVTPFVLNKGILYTLGSYSTNWNYDPVLGLHDDFIFGSGRYITATDLSFPSITNDAQYFGASIIFTDGSETTTVSSTTSTTSVSTTSSTSSSTVSSTSSTSSTSSQPSSTTEEESSEVFFTNTEPSESFDETDLPSEDTQGLVNSATTLSIIALISIIFYQ